MPSRSLVTVPKTYAEPLSSVRRVLIDGPREIDRVWVHSYRETMTHVS